MDFYFGLQEEPQINFKSNLRYNCRKAKQQLARLTGIYFVCADMDYTVLF